MRGTLRMRRGRLQPLGGGAGNAAGDAASARVNPEDTNATATDAVMQALFERADREAPTPSTRRYVTYPPNCTDVQSLEDLLHRTMFARKVAHFVKTDDHIRAS